MSLNTDELKGLVYDPTKIQSKIIDLIESASNGELVISDPTNPFVMLLEANAVNTANALNEMVVNTRKLYPSLAREVLDVQHHLSDEELINSFAYPSTTSLIFQLNLTNVRNEGYRASPTDNFVTVTIPEFTTITVSGVVFTAVNDINIKYYDDGRVFVEQVTSTRNVAINNIGVLKSAIITDKNQVDWIVFETLVKQLTRTIVEDTVIAGMGFNKKLKLLEEYYYAEVYYNNSSTGNQWVKLNLTYSDSVFDPLVPTVHARHLADEVEFTIPKVYLLNGSISGNIKIELYTTKGKLFLPTNRFEISDFEIKLGDTTTSYSKATAPNVTTLANSRVVVDGGRSAKTFEEMRDSVIYNTTGLLDLPITEKSLIEVASRNGMDLYKALDIITERIYVASKNMPNDIIENINSRIDMFMNTTSIVNADVVTNDSVVLTNDSLIIKAGSVFKEVNGVVTLLNNIENGVLNSAISDDIISYMGINRLYSTPYFYIVDVVNDIVASRVYNLNKPFMDNLFIVSKNNDTTINVNIDKYGIERTDLGYSIAVTLIGNDEFSNLGINTLGGQLRLPISVTEEVLTLDGVVSTDPDGSIRITFGLDTDFYINEDDSILLTNGVTVSPDKFIDLVTTATFVFYTTSVSNTDYTANDMIVGYGADALVVEQINIELGIKLEYLWSNVITGYTERKFATYPSDQVMYYEEDVYEVDPVTGAIFITTDTTGDGVCDTVEYPVRPNMHAGDPVLEIDANGDVVTDINGDPVYVYSHKAGDHVIDGDGNPVVDVMTGIIRHIDILMIEHEFVMANSPAYKDYLGLGLDIVRSWLSYDLPDLNSRSIDNTAIYFKPYKTAKDVSILLNGNEVIIPHTVKPKVTLYVDSNSIGDPVEIKRIIGRVLHKHLEGVSISYSAIKTEITEVINSSVVGVKLENLDNSGGIEAFTNNDKSNRLNLKKTLSYDNDNKLIVEYDIDLIIQTV